MRLILYSRIRLKVNFDSIVDGSTATTVVLKLETILEEYIKVILNVKRLCTDGVSLPTSLGNKSTLDKNSFGDITGESH